GNFSLAVVSARHTFDDAPPGRAASLMGDGEAPPEGHFHFPPRESQTFSRQPTPSRGRRAGAFAPAKQPPNGTRIGTRFSRRRPRLIPIRRVTLAEECPLMSWRTRIAWASAAAVLLAACTAGGRPAPTLAQKADLAPDELAEIAVEAYVYAYP